MTVHAIPGSNRNLFNEKSLNAYQQQWCIANTLHHTILSVNAIQGALLNPVIESDDKINSEHFCFLADNDSMSFIIDMGANCIIVNDVHLLNEFMSCEGSMKSIRGMPTTIKGIGRLTLPLLSDEEDLDELCMEAVYVSSSPYNLIPPQLLVNLSNKTVCKSNGSNTMANDMYLNTVTPKMKHGSLLCLSPTMVFLACQLNLDSSLSPSTLLVIIIMHIGI